jgi:hypothetical protein
MMSYKLYRPYLVLRLVSREPSSTGAASVFRYFKPDRFDPGVLEVTLVQACKEAKMAKWGIAPVSVSSDIVVYYLGPEHLLESTVAFINTQLIDNPSKRYRAEHPLRDTTHLKHSYQCQDCECRHHYYAWWCIDLDHQFALFKTRDAARLFLSSLLTTDLGKMGLEDFLKGAL